MTAVAIREGSRTRLALVTKRLIDLTGAAVLLVVSLPVLALAALAIRVEGGGPILFKQQRLGLHGGQFTMWKLRTMRTDADDAVHRAYVTNLLTAEEPESGGISGVYKLAEDPRVTRVGAFLRRSSIDELPQLWNVLAGTMSLVGPRPALAWEAELYQPDHHERFNVKPGVTGLWQVSGRSTVGMRTALDIDVHYANAWTVWLDIVVLAKTIPAVLRGSEAR